MKQLDAATEVFAYLVLDGQLGVASGVDSLEFAHLVATRTADRLGRTVHLCIGDQLPSPIHPSKEKN